MICNKGHEWEAIIGNRTRGNGCPNCSGKKASKDNCLATLNPQLANQWLPQKNSLTPHEVACNSHKKVWWLCSKGHEYEAIIKNKHKRGDGCPYCSGHKTLEIKSIGVLRPDLASEWHPILNGEMKPKDFLLNSNKKVWWFCQKGHEYESSIYRRTRGAGCRMCYRLKLSKNKNEK